MVSDHGLDILLDLNGESFHDESGFWWKIDAWLVQPSTEIPHGISYKLTLHDRYNKRVMGFDNAHAVDVTKKGKKLAQYKGRIVTWDHLHKTANDKGIAYEFVSAQQLLNDFFDHVNAIIDSSK